MSYLTKVGSSPDDTGFKFICRLFGKLHFKSVKSATGNAVNVF
jgi:hypothetical protein